MTSAEAMTLMMDSLIGWAPGDAFRFGGGHHCLGVSRGAFGLSPKGVRGALPSRPSISTAKRDPRRNFPGQKRRSWLMVREGGMGRVAVPRSLKSLPLVQVGQKAF